MREHMIMYVRNNKNTPVGVMYFKTTGLADSNDAPVVAFGWSKADNDDVFTKKMGRVIASRRADKVDKWANTKWIYQEALGIGGINDDQYHSRTRNFPYAIKNNIQYYLTKAKEHLGIDGPAIFIIPVLDRFVDVTDALTQSIMSVDTNDINRHIDKCDSTTRTTYIPVMF